MAKKSSAKCLNLDSSDSSDLRIVHHKILKSDESKTVRRFAIPIQTSN